MSRIDVTELFMELFNTAKEYVPEADHLEMCTKLLHVLSEQGFNIQSLHGDDEIVDQALEELEDDYQDEEDEY